MATKPTKKELGGAITPMRKQAERYAAGLMTGHPSPRHDAIVWRGIIISIELCRRQQVVCNVPAPYCAFHLYYHAHRDGKAIAHGDNGTMLVDNLFKLKGVF